MKVLIINGPNLNMLGKREPSIYGSTTYEELCGMIKDCSESLSKDLTCEFFVSNSEGEIVSKIQECLGNSDIAGIVLNAAAYSHYSIAIRDAVAMLDIPVVSVHISNIMKRESFRHEDVVAPVCTGIVSGLGLDGYLYALRYIYDRTLQ
ncbi:MAG: type II 3-dehydroquinate dehydratase [Lachnospiraceae bacterium]|nr:type II 3-dehydroquinate dehydratase [Lachnospiraceae bacterium]